MSPTGTPERGELARLAVATSCPACGGPVRDPVLLPCEHSCCRRCLLASLSPPADVATSPLSVSPLCPRCRRPCARGRVRSAVALAVEARIVRRLAGDSGGDSEGDRAGDSGDRAGDTAGTPTARRRRRSGRCSLGAKLRADAAPPPPPRDPPPK